MNKGRRSGEAEMNERASEWRRKRRGGAVLEWNEWNGETAH